MRRLAVLQVLLVFPLALFAAESPTPLPGFPNEAQALAFAKAVEAKVALDEPEFLQQSVNTALMLDVALKGLPVSDSLRRKFEDGFKGANDQGASLCESVRNGSTYKFLHLRWVDGRPRALFRHMTGAAAVYQELLLSLTSNGKIQIHDIFNYTTAELSTATLRRSVLPLVVQQEPGVRTSLPPAEADYLSNLPRIEKMRMQAAQGDPKGALAAFAALPETVRQDTNLLLWRHSVAAAVGGEAYAQACADLEQHLSPACVALVLKDVYYLTKQYDKALAQLERAQKELGGDAYLDVLRARVLGAEQKYAEARAEAQKAIAEEPTLPHAHFTLIEATLLEKNFAETVKAIDNLEDKLKISIGELKDLPFYSEFIKSKEFAEWLKRHQQK